MKKLIVINGTMGVGKTTVCSQLNKELTPSVWLDGDWCWHMNPWIVNDETKNMVEDNISYMLTNFINNSNFEWIIFNWVLHKEAIWEKLYQRLPLDKFELYRFTLVCDSNALRERMVHGNRSIENIEKSIDSLDLYNSLETVKIDTTDVSINEVAKKIINRLV